MYSGIFSLHSLMVQKLDIERKTVQFKASVKTSQKTIGTASATVYKCVGKQQKCSSSCK